MFLLASLGIWPTKSVTFCDVTMPPTECPPISPDHCLQMGFPRSYANKISRSSQYQGRKRTLWKSSWDKRMMLHLPETIYTPRPRVSSAAHRTVKVRWIIHRVDRRWTRELTSSLGSRPHQHVNADRRENEKEEERKTTWKEKRRNRETERERERARRLAFVLSPRVRIHLLRETVPFSLLLPLSFSIPLPLCSMRHSRPVDEPNCSESSR